MRNSRYIFGFRERLDEACYRTGLTKKEIAKRGNFDRKCLYPSQNDVMSSVNIAKFCAVTKTDANWLLGITRYENEKVKSNS